MVWSVPRFQKNLTLDNRQLEVFLIFIRLRQIFPNFYHSRPKYNIQYSLGNRRQKSPWLSYRFRDWLDSCLSSQYNLHWNDLITILSVIVNQLRSQSLLSRFKWFFLISFKRFRKKAQLVYLVLSNYSRFFFTVPDF